MQANLAGLYGATGRAAEAESGFRRALDIDREVGNRWSEGVALGGLAGVLRLQGRAGPAIRAFDEALAIHRELGNRRFEAAHSCDRALALLAAGDPSAADAWRTGAAILRSLGDTVEAGQKSAEMRRVCGKAGIAPFDERPA